MKKKKLGIKEIKKELSHAQAMVRAIGYDETQCFEHDLTMTDEEIKEEITGESDIFENLPIAYHKFIIQSYRKNKLDQLRNSHYLAKRLNEVADTIFDLVYDG